MNIGRNTMELSPQTVSYFMEYLNDAIYEELANQNLFDDDYKSNKETKVRLVSLLLFCHNLFTRVEKKFNANKKKQEIPRMITIKYPTNVVKAGVVPSVRMNNKSYYLLVHQGKSKKWGYPKGTMEIGESVLSCAARELYEETGLTISETTLSVANYIITKQVLFFFVELVKKPPITIDTRELIDYCWVARSKLQEYFNKMSAPSKVVTKKLSGNI